MNRIKIRTHAHAHAHAHTHTYTHNVPFRTKKNFFGERKVSLVGLVNLISPVSWRAGLLSLVYRDSTHTHAHTRTHTHTEVSPPY